jgi:hypothetical protein
MLYKRLNLSNVWKYNGFSSEASFTINSLPSPSHYGIHLRSHAEAERLAASWISPLFYERWLYWLASDKDVDKWLVSKLSIMRKDINIDST